MKYTLDYVDRRGRIDHFDLLECQDDAEAGLAARAALIYSTRAERVEVWDETRRVISVCRTSASAPGSRPRG